MYNTRFIQLYMNGLYHVRYGCSNRLSSPITYHFLCCLQISESSLRHTSFQQKLYLSRGLTMIKRQIQRQHLSLIRGRNETEKKTSSPMSTQLSSVGVLLFAKWSQHCCVRFTRYVFLSHTPLISHIKFRTWETWNNLLKHTGSLQVTTGQIHFLSCSSYVCISKSRHFILTRTQHIWVVCHKTEPLHIYCNVEKERVFSIWIRISNYPFVILCCYVTAFRTVRILCKCNVIFGRKQVPAFQINWLRDANEIWFPLVINPLAPWETWL